MSRKDYESHIKGYYVEVKHGNLERALKILKRRMKDDNWIVSFQKHEHYIKPSEIRRDKKHRSKRRARAENLEN